MRACSASKSTSVTGGRGMNSRETAFRGATDCIDKGDGTEGSGGVGVCAVTGGGRSGGEM